MHIEYKYYKYIPAVFALSFKSVVICKYASTIASNETVPIG